MSSMTRVQRSVFWRWRKKEKKKSNKNKSNSQSRALTQSTSLTRIAYENFVKKIRIEPSIDDKYFIDTITQTKVSRRRVVGPSHLIIINNFINIIIVIVAVSLNFLIPTHGAIGIRARKIDNSTLRAYINNYSNLELYPTIGEHIVFENFARFPLAVGVAAI